MDWKDAKRILEGQGHVVVHWVPEVLEMKRPFMELASWSVDGRALVSGVELAALAAQVVEGGCEA